MIIDLPDDHPIAKVIRDTTRGSCHDLWLSLDALGPQGHRRLFSLRIDNWKAREKKEKRFELELVDEMQRQREIEQLGKWPTLPSNDA